MADDAISVTDDAEQSRYVLTVDDEPAGVLVYRSLRSAQPTRVFLHTQVDPAHEGRGLGSTLIAAALADARAQGVAVLPQCPFVKAYLQRHPEEADVVPSGERTAYGLPPA